jgi:hypothetical protein
LGTKKSGAPLENSLHQMASLRRLLIGLQSALGRAAKRPEASYKREKSQAGFCTQEAFRGAYRDGTRGIRPGPFCLQLAMDRCRRNLQHGGRLLIGHSAEKQQLHDLGSGVGDVALLLASIAGATAEIVGRPG